MKCTSLASQRESKVDSSESKMKIGGLASNNSTQSAIFESASDGFGESVPYVPLNQCSVPANQCIEKVSSIDLDKSNAADSIDEVEILKRNRLRNIAVATASFVYAIFNYGWQLTHPVTAVEILATMQSQSAPLTAIGNNGKPTVIDFWAPWCENCKVAAPTLKAVEEEYGDQVNFIMVNGDDAANWPLIELFGVDAIPHLALVNGKGDVETALIGPMSRNVLRADINALLTDREDCEVVPVCHDELPYIMYDAFGNRPDSRRINFAQQ
jgi:thiol-disulfide isomerase/thioredoxin